MLNLCLLALIGLLIALDTMYRLVREYRIVSFTLIVALSGAKLAWDLTAFGEDPSAGNLTSTVLVATILLVTLMMSVVRWFSKRAEVKDRPPPKWLRRQ